MERKDPALKSIEDLFAVAAAPPPPKTVVSKSKEDIEQAIFDEYVSSLGWRMPYRPQSRRLASLFRFAIKMRALFDKKGTLVCLGGTLPDSLDKDTLVGFFDKEFSQLLSEYKGNSVVRKAAKIVWLEGENQFPGYEKLAAVSDDEDKSAVEPVIQEEVLQDLWTRVEELVKCLGTQHDIGCFSFRIRVSSWKVPKDRKNPALHSVDDLFAAAASHGGKTKFPKTDVTSDIGVA